MFKENQKCLPREAIVIPVVFLLDLINYFKCPEMAHILRLPKNIFFSTMQLLIVETKWF